MSKVFVVDIAKCNGCRNCQIVCKDEHCGQPWLPYTDEQPMTGHFWMNVTEKTRGRVPVVKVSYVPIMCNHCTEGACKKVGGDAVYARDDGLVIIDPEKAVGRKDIAEACPLGAIYWNEEKNLPQKCTGCAHLLDEGWKEPRCVDSCTTGALKFIEESSIDLDEAITLESVKDFGPKVYYFNYPRRFIAGTVYDSNADEVVIGAHVSLLTDEAEVASCETDDFGDFRFEQVEAASYTVKIDVGAGVELSANAVELDVSFDDIDIA